MLAKQVHCSDTEPTVCVPKADSKFVFKTITNVQVLKILPRLVNGKATGLHGIPNKAIKSSATLITPALTYIFNISIKTRVFPCDFKLAKVTPVFKSGDRCNDQSTNRHSHARHLIRSTFILKIYRHL